MFKTNKRLTVAKTQRGSRVTASSFLNMGMSGRTVISTPGIGNQTDTLLGGILTQDNRVLNKYYEDIYVYDVVSGAMVDLCSTLPFSDFTLSGVPEAQMLETFEDAVETLGLKSLHTQMSVDYLVYGRFIGSMIYKKEQKLFTDIMLFEQNDIDAEYLPTANSDPIFRVKISSNLRKMVNTSDKNNEMLHRIRARFPESLIQAIKTSNEMVLEPLTTLYLARRTSSMDLMGTSAFKRILPLYLLEKILYRGTLTEAGRRQRAIMHITCLSGDTEIVTQQDGIKTIGELIEHSKGIPCSADIDLNIMGFDGKFHTATRWHYRGEKPTITVHFENDTHLICTPDHKILVYDYYNGQLDWKAAADTLGLSVYTPHGNNILCVVDITEHKTIPVYDLTMDENTRPCFVANGVVVHNCGNEDWEPNEEDLANISSLFQQADLDPTGAIIATRRDINVSEVRCLAGNTVVTINDEDIRIKDLVDHDPNTMEPYTCVTLPDNTMVKNYQGNNVLVQYWWYQGVQPTYKITMYDGNCIQATENHKFLSIGLDYSLEMLTVKEMQTRIKRNPVYMVRIPKKLYDKDNPKQGVPLNYLIKKMVEWDSPVFRKLLQTPVLMNNSYWDGNYSKQLAFIREHAPDIAKNLSYLLENSFILIPVVKITFSGKAPVYDLTINPQSGPPLFLANGVVSHNSGGDFWKFTDIVDLTNSLKMKAHGISDAFLSGDMNFNAAETALSTFIENLRAFRENFTRAVYYDKVFPLIALVNGFYHREKEMEQAASEKIMDQSDFISNDSAITRKIRMDKTIAEGQTLVIPDIQWHKQLRPMADQDFLQVMETLESKGVPLGLRAWAAAGGLSIDKLVDSFEDNLRVEQEIKELKEKYGKSDGDDDDDYAFASVARSGDKEKNPFLGRDFSKIEDEHTETTKTGKKKFVYNQRKAKQKAHEVIATSLKKLSDEQYYQQVLRSNRYKRRNNLF